MHISSVQLKKLRLSLNLTQDEFANKIGVKRNSISMIESGRNKPTFDMIVDICSVFNISADYFLGELNLQKNGGFKNQENVNDNDINNEADFLNQAHEGVRRVNFLFQKLIDVRVLLFQELKIRADLSTAAEVELLNALARPAIKEINNESEFAYPYQNLDDTGKTQYLLKLDACINLFTNTFFECFEQLYGGIRIPIDREAKNKFLTTREKLTDHWKYGHLK